MEYRSPDWCDDGQWSVGPTSFPMQSIDDYGEWMHSLSPTALSGPDVNNIPYQPSQFLPSPPSTQYGAASPSLSISSSNREPQPISSNIPYAQPQIDVCERILKDKATRRRDQNRVSQRAHRDRQRQRIEKLQQEIQELKASCWALEKRNEKLGHDLQIRWRNVLRQLKSELEKPEAIDAAHREAVGWMLKHGYETHGAGDGCFSVFPVQEPLRPERSDCTIC